MKYENFLKIVNFNYYENELELRYGQVLMNMLYQIWPEKYKEISGTVLDCYYKTVPEESEILLEKLKADWL